MSRMLRLIIVMGLTVVMGLLGGCHPNVSLPGPFEGRITDIKTGHPIAGARVEMENWRHDNPLPDGPGSFFVRADTKTDESGFFRLKKETRRGGYFGCSFALKISAEGYIPATLIYEPKGVPLPPETRAYPFVHTATFDRLPRKLEVRLAPALPVLLAAIKSGKPDYMGIAREMLAKLIGVDYGYDADKWEKAVTLKKK
jgi:hypothetical protein